MVYALVFNPTLTVSFSKQRHNKLWRSHSDSDLSEHHEPLTKSSQPLSLGRSDPHNQTSNKSGPSVKELLESLGMPAASGKPVEQTSGEPVEKSKQLSSSLPKDVEVLSGYSQSVETPCPSAVVQTSPESTAGCVSRSPPSLTNGSYDSKAQASSLPLSEPRAAAVVPELQKTDKMTVAQSVSVGQPHPPPSFYHPVLSPVPPPAPACMHEVNNPQTLSHSPPATKPTVVSVPEPLATQSASTQQTPVQCLSAPVPVKKTDCDQPTCGLSLNGLAAQLPSTNDFIDYPSAIPQDSEVLLGHSGDHINFFSAREKFKGMSQDGKSCQLKSCGKDPQPLPQEVLHNEGKEEERRKVGLVAEIPHTHFQFENFCHTEFLLNISQTLLVF